MIVQLTTHDVLFGRGSHRYRNEGNIRFRRLILDHRILYEKTRKGQKCWIADSIIHLWKEMGGRFLEQKGNGWVEASSALVRTKTIVALQRRPNNSLSNLHSTRQEPITLCTQPTNKSVADLQDPAQAKKTPHDDIGEQGLLAKDGDNATRLPLRKRAIRESLSARELQSPTQSNVDSAPNEVSRINESSPSQQSPTVLKTTDVVFGLSNMHHHAGNAKFRKLIRSYGPIYAGSGSQSLQRFVCAIVLRGIQSFGGSILFSSAARGSMMRRVSQAEAIDLIDGSFRFLLYGKCGQALLTKTSQALVSRKIRPVPVMVMAGRSTPGRFFLLQATPNIPPGITGCK